MKAFVFTLFLAIIALAITLICWILKFNAFRELTRQNTETLKEGLKTHKNSINRLNKVYEEMQKALEEACNKLEKIYNAEKNGNMKDANEILSALTELRKISKK